MKRYKLKQHMAECLAETEEELRILKRIKTRTPYTSVAELVTKWEGRVTGMLDLKKVVYESIEAAEKSQ